MVRRCRVITIRYKVFLNTFLRRADFAFRNISCINTLPSWNLRYGWGAEFYFIAVRISRVYFMSIREEEVSRGEALGITFKDAMKHVCGEYLWYIRKEFLQKSPEIYFVLVLCPWGLGFSCPYLNLCYIRDRVPIYFLTRSSYAVKKGTRCWRNTRPRCGSKI